LSTKVECGEDEKHKGGVTQEKKSQPKRPKNGLRSMMLSRRHEMKRNYWGDGKKAGGIKREK